MGLMDKVKASAEVGLAKATEASKAGQAKLDAAQAKHKADGLPELEKALNADPTSQFLNNGLAELYFKTGKIKDAIVAAQDLLKKDPNNLDAHKLLGRIYLRSLGDGQAGGPSGQVLQLAIAEYSKIVALEPGREHVREPPALPLAVDTLVREPPVVLEQPGDGVERLVADDARRRLHRRDLVFRRDGGGVRHAGGEF